MAMSVTWTLMVAASLVCGAACGTLGDVTAAAMEGASAAVELTLSMAGALCLWSGVMTVMERGGMTEGLARLFRPLLRRILPQASRDPDTLAAVSANVSANLLGLGNAATPLGIRAAQRMAAGMRFRSAHSAVPAGGKAAGKGLCGGAAGRPAFAATLEGVAWILPPFSSPSCWQARRCGRCESA